MDEPDLDGQPQRLMVAQRPPYKVQPPEMKTTSVLGGGLCQDRLPPLAAWL